MMQDRLSKNIYELKNDNKFLYVFVILICTKRSMSPWQWKKLPQVSQLYVAINTRVHCHLLITGYFAAKYCEKINILEWLPQHNQQSAALCAFSNCSTGVLYFYSYMESLYIVV